MHTNIMTLTITWFHARISSLANFRLVGLFTQRAESKQAGAQVSQTAGKIPTEIYISNTLYTCPKNAPQTCIIREYNTSSSESGTFRMRPNSEYPNRI